MELPRIEAKYSFLSKKKEKSKISTREDADRI